MMGKVIAIVNQKGGVAKTTTALNLGPCLEELGKKVLLVDLDPQAHLSLGFGVELKNGEPSVYNYLFDNRVRFGQVCWKITENIHLIPSDINLSAADLQLVSEMNRERLLRKKLDGWRDKYDYVIIDNGPNLSLLVVNSLTAADYALIPVQSAFWALKGMGKLMDTISRIRDNELNKDLKVLGILLTMVDPRTTISHQISDRLNEAFGVSVFDTYIKRTVQFDYSTVQHKPLVLYAPNSEVAEAYRSIAKEVVSRAEKT